MDSLISIFDTTLRSATPLVLAALAGCLVERSGLIEISLEGKMLLAAFAAGAVAHWSGSPWLAVAVAFGVTAVLALVHGWVVITMRGNQLICGLALNFVVMGLTPVLALVWFQAENTTPRLDDAARLSNLVWPGAAVDASAAADSSLLGQLYARVISGHSPITYLMLVLVPLVIWLMYQTRFGLRLRAAGSNPHALDTAGVSVAATRYLTLLAASGLCALAGAYLSLSGNSGWVQNMTAGKGFLALAAVVFGKWRPGPTVAVCIMFAVADALQVRIQNVDLPVVGVIPSDFIQMLPYVLTVLLLAGLMGRAHAPKASGIPFEKSR